MKFLVTIEELISENFEVDAETVEDAIEIAKEKYNNGKFVLEPGNLVSKQMAIVSNNNELNDWIEF